MDGICDLTKLKIISLLTTSMRTPVDYFQDWDGGHKPPATLRNKMTIKWLIKKCGRMTYTATVRVAPVNYSAYLDEDYPSEVPPHLPCKAS